MLVAIVGLDLSLDLPYEDRVARATALVRDQRGTDLVVLPELWAHGAFAYETWPEAAEPIDGPTATALSAAAADIGAHVLGGSIMERTPEALYNTAVLFGPDGALVATYRKIHRFGFGAGEATALEHGTEIVTYPVGDAVLGLATCYDLRFPEMFRALVDAGATVIAIPACWPDKRIDHWRLLARARAVDSQAYVLACNGIGSHAGYRMGGYAAVVDPWGEVLAEAGSVAEEVLTVDIDPAYVRKTRDGFPVVRDRILPLST